jgi:predicted DNA-binding transcriptional regulator AlpA
LFKCAAEKNDDDWEPLTNHHLEIRGMEKILVSVADATQMIGLGKTSLYELMNQGKLETRKIGNRRLILVSSLRQLADAA